MWRGGAWHLRDLGSSNGTFVAGERLAPGESTRLSAGQMVAFGRLDDAWTLFDDGAPSALAQRIESGAWAHAADGLLALPGPDNPRVVVFQATSGAWVAEWADGIRAAVADGEVIDVDSERFRMQLPAEQEGTAPIDGGMSLDAIRLRFEVSLDEEHVTLVLLHRGTETALESREHAYLLLTLARLRIEEAGQPLPEQGWVERDRLLRMLHIDGNALNVGIYRARRQLTGAGVSGGAGIVEVRRGQRRFGLAPSRVELSSR